VLDAVPSSLQPKVKAALHNIMNAEDKQAAEVAIDQFQATYGAKYPKAVDKVLKDREVLLTHFDFPVEHWIHIRTTDEIVKPGEWRQAQELLCVPRFSLVEPAPARRAVSTVVSTWP
jgi:transposase-like protein